MKNPKNPLLAAVLAAVFMMGTACSLKVDGKKNEPPPPAPPQKLTDDYNGDWVSDCMVYPVGHSVYHIIAMNISGDGMTYTESFYRDATCETENTDSRQVLEGTYVLQKGLSDGRQLVEMKIPAGPNVWAIRELNIKKDGEFLFISPFFNSAFDDAEAVTVRYKLAKVVEDDGGENGGGDDNGGGEIINDLIGGTYLPVSGNMDFCPQMVTGTGKQDGKLFMVFVTVQCQRSFNLNMTCENNVCTDSGFTLTLKSETSYGFSDAEGETAVFEKR